MATKPCLTGRSSDIHRYRFRLPSAKAKYLNLPNNRTTAPKKKSDDFKGWAVFTDGRTHSTDGETAASLGAVSRSPDGRLYVNVGPVVTTEAHLVYDTNNTAELELSSMNEALSFRGPAGIQKVLGADQSTLHGSDHTHDSQCMSAFVLDRRA